MAYQAIGLGTSADDGTGDPLRTGADKVNDNFVEIYTLLGTGSVLTSGISATATVVTLTAPTISGVVGGTQTSATITTLTSTTVTGTTLNAGTLAAGNITVGTITSTAASIVLEGATADAYETTLTVTDPTADRTITFPNVSGTVITTADSNTVTGTIITTDTVAEANMADDSVGSDQLKTLVTLLIKDSGGTTLKTIYGAGA